VATTISHVAAQLSLGETASGKGATGPGGRPVSLPVGELSSTVGLIAGVGGHETASIVVGELAAAGLPVVVLDRGGRLADLVGEAGVVTCHRGSDADLPLEPGRAAEAASRLDDRDEPVVVDGRRTDGTELASLASTLLDENDASGTRTVVVAGLAAALSREEPVGEFGRAIRRLVTRGPDRGLGLVGVVDRPAALTETVRTAWDWSIWHRLNRTADTSVVRRELGGERAQAVRELADGEAFLSTDWTDSVDRIAVDRSRSRSATRKPRRGEVDRDSTGRAELSRIVDRLESVARTLDDEPDPDRVAEELADAFEPRLGPAPAESGGPEPAESGAADEFTDTEGTGDEEAFAGIDLLDDDGAGDADGSEPGSASDPTDGLAALAGAGEAAADASAVQANGDRVAGSSASLERGEADSIVGDGGLDVDPFSAELAAFEAGAAAVETAGASAGGKPAVVVDVESTLEDIDDAARSMLEHYRSEGPARPEAAHSAATGRAARVPAYRLNRQLRRAGLIQHVGRGRYEYSLRERLAAGLPAERDEDMATVYARDLEQSYLD
jgi:hypothetical protein